MNAALEVFIYSEQPTTCPKCGLRTKIIYDFPFSKEKKQIHKCSDDQCGFEFVVQEDLDFEDGSLL